MPRMSVKKTIFWMVIPAVFAFVLSLSPLYLFVPLAYALLSVLPNPFTSGGRIANRIVVGMVVGSALAVLFWHSAFFFLFLASLVVMALTRNNRKDKLNSWLAISIWLISSLAPHFTVAVSFLVFALRSQEVRKSANLIGLTVIAIALAVFYPQTALIIVTGVMLFFDLIGAWGISRMLKRKQ